MASLPALVTSHVRIISTLSTPSSPGTSKCHPDSAPTQCPEVEVGSAQHCSRSNVHTQWSQCSNSHNQHKCSDLSMRCNSLNDTRQLTNIQYLKITLKWVCYLLEYYFLKWMDKISNTHWTGNYTYNMFQYLRQWTYMPSVAFTASSASSFSRKTTNAKQGGDFATHISLRGPYLSKTCCNSRFDTPIPVTWRYICCHDLYTAIWKHE